MSAVTKFKKACRFLFDSDYRFLVSAGRGWLGHLASDNFLKRLYRIRMGKELDLDCPTAYTEKLQWLKLYDHRPEYTVMVDKYAVKDFVASKIGKEYTIPIIGVWDRVEDIDFDSLPERFVLKATHDSGSYVVCTSKKELDLPAVRKKLRKALARKYYNCNREWPYKNVKPRIIAEQYMEDSHCEELRDYKFFTFGGVPKVLYITQGRGKGEPTVADFFDMDFNHLDLTIDHDMAPIPPEKPKCFDEMKRLAAILSEGTPQLRVDFYEVDGRVFFGEMTFFHCSGTDAFNPDEWDMTFGDWVVLPEASNEGAS